MSIRVERVKCKYMEIPLPTEVIKTISYPFGIMVMRYHHTLEILISSDSYHISISLTCLVCVLENFTGLLQV